MSGTTTRGPGTRETTQTRELSGWVRWTVLPLLILVPIGYLLISAAQSRDSGEDKQQEAAATVLTHHAWPTKVQRRIYQVPIPLGSTNVGFLETNSWKTSSLYVQFATTPGGLDSFLAQIHTSRAALRHGYIPIRAAQAKRAGWTWRSDRLWAGALLTQHGAKPDHSIVVNLGNPNRPYIYLVSTMDFT
jgi:hypothetical protein